MAGSSIPIAKAVGLALVILGAGLIVWHPKGCMLRHILEDFEVNEHLKRGYELVKGPHVG